MKNFFTTISALVFSTTLFAQSYAPKLKVDVGSKYKVDVTSTGNMSQEAMGQTMEIPLESSTTSTLEIKKAVEKGYDAGYTNNHIKFSMSAMGQEMNYDSDKKEDKDSQIGKTMGDRVNKESTFTVDFYGNVIKETISKKEEPKQATEDDGMMTGMLKNFGLGENSCPALNLFTSNKELNIGDSFIDSSSTNDADGKSKSITTYTLKEIKDKDAIFTIVGNAEMNKKMEMQGIEMTTSTNVKSVGEMKVNSTTGLLAEKTITATTNGTVDVQGMSIPITGKIVSKIIVTQIQ